MLFRSIKILFLYYKFFTIQHKILFQRLTGFDSKLVIYVGKKGIVQKIMIFNQRTIPSEKNSSGRKSLLVNLIFSLVIIP